MTTSVMARLDAELVRRGLVRSRRRASDLVADGHVLVGGEPARKPSQPVGPEDVIELADTKQDAVRDYVSRAAHKLAGALDAVATLAPGAVSVGGRACLDAGASTGGFTQVLLERGARHVLAVDVGHGQMAADLRSDPRVTCREGVNVRDLRPEDLPSPPQLVTADLSFISLTLVAPALLAVAAPAADLLLMVKPQFEVGRERLGSAGVVTSGDLRIEAVERVATVCEDGGGSVRAVVPSPLPGETGNREYFLWVRVEGRPEAVPAGRVTPALPGDRRAPVAGDEVARPSTAGRHHAPGAESRLGAAVRAAVLDDRPARVGVDA